MDRSEAEASLKLIRTRVGEIRKNTRVEYEDFQSLFQIASDAVQQGFGAGSREMEYVKGVRALSPSELEQLARRKPNFIHTGDNGVTRILKVPDSQAEYYRRKLDELDEVVAALLP